LKGLRELADRHGVLLIFDEIITFRLSLGGLQRLEGVRPDITALGKIIGGGFAVGAFGGRKEIMARFDPAHPKTIMHSGTFCGHNVTMAAGVAALQGHGQTEIDRINQLGERLREGFDQAFRAAGIKGQTTGLGSLMQVHWRDGEITSPRDTGIGILGAKDLPRLMHLEMMNRGIFAAPRGMYCISTPMTEKEVDRAIGAFAATLEVLKPHVAEATPHLIAG
jgi:glutamate-1-semialdehyde 2,1-aminomutase